LCLEYTKAMITYCSDLQQDTIPSVIVINQDSVQSKSDSGSIIKNSLVKDSVYYKPVTTSVITRFVVNMENLENLNKFITGYGFYRQ